MADELGDALILDTPVREINQDERGVTVWGDGIEVSAERVVIAIPPTLAGHKSHYEPLLADRSACT